VLRSCFTTEDRSSQMRHRRAHSVGTLEIRDWQGRPVDESALNLQGFGNRADTRQDTRDGHNAIRASARWSSCDDLAKVIKRQILEMRRTSEQKEFKDSARAHLAYAVVVVSPLADGLTGNTTL